MDTVDTSEFFTLYPHLGVKIRALWGSKECRVILMSLLNDSRDGSRAGFPVSIGKTIFSLLKAHDVKFPQFDDKDALPFTGVRSRPVIVKQQHDWGIVATAAKIIAFVLIAAVLYKIYKKL